MKRLFAFLISLLLVLSLSGCIEPLVLLFSTVPEPKVTYGEFPFELVCEIDGEEVTFKDTVIIEHKGTEISNIGQGRENKWDRSFLNSEGYYTNQDGQIIADDILLKKGYSQELGREYEIIFYLGSSEYYMGVEEYDIHYRPFGVYPGDFMIRAREFEPIDEETLYEKYNIKIIKKSISEPLADNVK